MKIVGNGNTYNVISGGLSILDTLPTQTYTVEYDEMKGFYLKVFPDLSIKEEKIYGVHIDKVHKVFKAFKKTNKNLGTILSGEKGIGKSLFANLMAVESIKEGMPIIIVNKYVPGIAQYIESIDQEVMVMMDEFDKIFSKNIRASENDPDPQVSFLSLFNGVTNGKKLFVITCNNVYELNEFLINRPGRFHYHFRFNFPTASEITTYLQDNLDKEYYDQIESVILFSHRVPLNYDCLRSIVFELNMGTTFKEAILDLNIMNVDEKIYNIEIHFEDGTVLYEMESLDMFSPLPVKLRFCSKTTYDTIARISFSPLDAKWDKRMKATVIKPDKPISIEFSDDVNEEYENLKETAIKYIKFEPISQKGMHYNLSELV